MVVASSSVPPPHHLLDRGKNNGVVSGLFPPWETKFYDLDLKVTEIQTTVEQLQEEGEERKGKATTEVF